MATDHNVQERRRYPHRGRRGPDRRSPDRRPPAATQPAERAGVDVDQIMRDIRSRIAQRHGIDLSPEQIQELAARRIEAILEPRGLPPALLEQFRRGTASPPSLPDLPEPRVIEEAMLYDSPSGFTRGLRRLLRPILRLFLDPAALTRAVQSQTQVTRALAAREAERDRWQAEWNALHYEILQRLATDVARASLEMQSLSLRVEALAARVEFNERRVRTIESAGPAPAAKGARPADRPDRADRGDRTERADRPDRGERSERPERGGRADRGERPDRENRVDSGERADRAADRAAEPAVALGPIAVDEAAGAGAGAGEIGSADGPRRKRRRRRSKRGGAGAGDRPIIDAGASSEDDAGLAEEFDSAEPANAEAIPVEGDALVAAAAIGETPRELPVQHRPLPSDVGAAEASGLEPSRSEAARPEAPQVEAPQTEALLSEAPPAVSQPTERTVPAETATPPRDDSHAATTDLTASPHDLSSTAPAAAAAAAPAAGAAPDAATRRESPDDTPAPGAAPHRESPDDTPAPGSSAATPDDRDREQ